MGGCRGVGHSGNGMQRGGEEGLCGKERRGRMVVGGWEEEEGLAGGEKEGKATMRVAYSR